MVLNFSSESDIYAISAISRPAFSATTRFLECKQTHRDRPRVAGQFPTVRDWSWASCGSAVRRTASRSAPTLLGISKRWPTWRFCESLNGKAKTPTRCLGGLRTYLRPQLILKARVYILKCFGRGLCRDPELLLLWTGLGQPPPSARRTCAMYMQQVTYKYARYVS